MPELELPEPYELIVPGKPVPWTKGAGFGKGPPVPAKQSVHVGLIRQCWAEQHPDGLWLEKGKPVRLSGEFWTPRPKTQYGSGTNAKEPKSTEYSEPARLYPTGTPDLSNLLKMVEDAMKQVLWADDDQVVDISGSKRYVHWWEPGRSIIKITPLPFTTLHDFEVHVRQQQLT